MLKWTTKNTHIKTVGEVTQKDNSMVAAVIVGIIGLILFLSVIPMLVKTIENSNIENPFGSGNSISRPYANAEATNAIHETNYGY